MTSILSVNSNIFSDIDFDYDDVLILSKLHPILRSKLRELTTLTIDRFIWESDFLSYSRLRYLTATGAGLASSALWNIRNTITSLNLKFADSASIERLIALPSSLTSLTIPLDLNEQLLALIPPSVTDLEVERQLQAFPLQIVTLRCTMPLYLHEGILSLTIVGGRGGMHYMACLPRSLTHLDAENDTLHDTMSGYIRAYPNLTSLKCNMSLDAMIDHLTSNPGLTSVTNTARQSSGIVPQHTWKDVVFSPLITHLNLFYLLDIPKYLVSLQVVYVEDPSLLPDTLQHLVIDELSVGLTTKLVNLLTLRVKRETTAFLICDVLPPRLTDLELHMSPTLTSCPWNILPDTLMRLKMSTISEYKAMSPLPMLHSLTYICKCSRKDNNIDSGILPRTLTDLDISCVASIIGTIYLYNLPMLPPRLLTVRAPKYDYNMGTMPRCTYQKRE